MAEVAGWVVAVLVAVVAVLVRMVTNARQKAVNASSRPPVDESASQVRQAVTKATKAEIEGLWDTLEGDDPSGGIATAANEARNQR